MTPPAVHADPAATETLSVDDLRDLVGSFNEATTRLQSTHAALQGQVARLQDELAEANAQLRRSRSLAALGEMAAGIAHELRNPLGCVSLYTQMLQDDLDDRPEQASVCDRIAAAVSRLDAIVGDVLAFARDTRLNVVRTTPADIVDRSLEDCRGLFDQTPTRLVRDGVGGDPIEADVALVAQAVGNLVRNALDAMADLDEGDRELRLDARWRSCRMPDGARDERMVIAVEDRGPGIPSDVRSRMFNPFFTTRDAGTGLGLAIVHRIIDAHGGHVAVAEAEGGGARLELCLPARPPASTLTLNTRDGDGTSLSESIRRRTRTESAA
jgi:signal transduction histidine kinase